MTHHQPSCIAKDAILFVPLKRTIFPFSFTTLLENNYSRHNHCHYHRYHHRHYHLHWHHRHSHCTYLSSFLYSFLILSPQLLSFFLSVSSFNMILLSTPLCFHVFLAYTGLLFLDLCLFPGGGKGSKSSLISREDNVGALVSLYSAVVGHHFGRAQMGGFNSTYGREGVRVVGT